MLFLLHVLAGDHATPTAWSVTTKICALDITQCVKLFIDLRLDCCDELARQHQGTVDMCKIQM